MMYAGNDQMTAASDSTAISEANKWQFEGMVIAAGLTMRKVFNLPFNQPQQGGPRVGALLRQFLQQDPDWKQELSKYDLKWTQNDQEFHRDLSTKLRYNTTAYLQKYRPIEP